MADICTITDAAIPPEKTPMTNKRFCLMFRPTVLDGVLLITASAFVRLVNVKYLDKGLKDTDANMTQIIVVLMEHNVTFVGV